MPNAFFCPLCIFLDPSPQDSVPVMLSPADTLVGPSGPLDMVPLFPYQTLPFPTWLCGDLTPLLVNWPGENSQVAGYHNIIKWEGGMGHSADPDIPGASKVSSSLSALAQMSHFKSHSSTPTLLGLWF